MAALGIVTTRVPTEQRAVRVPVSAYTVVRGNYLGGLTLRVPPPRAPKRATLDNYIVRQISIVYRQLWPNHGQRFPQ